MEYVKIGNVEIEKTAALAPMASVSDTSYRQLCKEFGASYVVGEMVSSKGLFYSDKKTKRLLNVTDFERPMAVQIFGDDPYYMAKAVQVCLEYSPDIIDINMGCPVPKVAGNGSGSALMKNPILAKSIIEAVVKESTVPVSVKIRKGWDDENVNAVEIAKIAEDAGVSAITVHGRTKRQMYSGKADWDIIRQVKEAVNVTVIGNGDVYSLNDCIEMYKKTNCDLVMIARGSYGNPWIFSDIKEYFQNGTTPKAPTNVERMQVMLRHVKMIVDENGEENGMKMARKFAAWYLKGMKGAASLRNKCYSLTTYNELETLANEVLNI